MAASVPEITPLGDSALIVRVRDQFEDAPEETLSEVARAVSCLNEANIAGVIEVAPAYTTVAVFFDPIQIIKAGAEPARVIDWLHERILSALNFRSRRVRSMHEPRSIEIPVCYGADFGPDLEAVAQHAQLSATEVVDLHKDGKYRVACLGFTPGFPFLSGLSKKLETPRRATPRKEIPPGAVAIGGAQTGIYPLRSPGGWNIIGRTPVRLFDPAKDPPALLAAGDRVSFRSISREEFDSM